MSQRGGTQTVMGQPGARKRYRTLFISDVHLGTKACRAAELLDLLRHTEADTIYLVGDIIDFWRLGRSSHWPQSHNDVLQKLLRKARKGTRLILIPGNHDEVLRDYCGTHFGGIEIADSLIHVTADNRKLLVIHGDQFDVVVQYAKWLAFLGDWAYTLALFGNTQLNRIRRRLGLEYWSVSAYLKLRVKKAVNYIGEFETALAAEAERHGACGVVCGHIHHAAIRPIGNVLYVNTGDWVESATAVAEGEDGSLEILYWSDIMTRRKREGAEAERQLDLAA